MTQLINSNLAENYHRLRPGYLPEMIDACLQFGGLAVGDRLLEIGAGTGKATRDFAERGFGITAVEREPEMIAVADSELAQYSGQVHFVEGTLDATIAEGKLDDQYDGAYVAMAWRWLTPYERTQSRIHRLLRPAGCLAILENSQIVTDGEGDQFINGLFKILSDHEPTLYGMAIYPRTTIHPVPLEQKYFKPVHYQTVRKTFRLTMDDYTELANSPTGYDGFPTYPTRHYLDEVQELFDQFGGMVELPMMDTVQIARKVD